MIIQNPIDRAARLKLSDVCSKRITGGERRIFAGEIIFQKLERRGGRKRLCAAEIIRRKLLSDAVPAEIDAPVNDYRRGWIISCPSRKRAGFGAKLSQSVEREIAVAAYRCIGIGRIIAPAEAQLGGRLHINPQSENIVRCRIRVGGGKFRKTVRCFEPAWRKRISVK